MQESFIYLKKTMQFSIVGLKFQTAMEWNETHVVFFSFFNSILYFLISIVFVKIMLKFKVIQTSMIFEFFHSQYSNVN